MRQPSLHTSRRATILRAGAALALGAVAATGCGATAPAPATRPAAKQAAPVRLALLTPRAGTRTGADHVTVRGTVSPANAVVLVQGRPATVGDGVFVGTASIHRGRTRIDVIASARDATPASVAVAVTRPRRHHEATKAPAPPVHVTVVNGGGTTVCPNGVAVSAGAVCATPAAPYYSGSNCDAGVSVGPNTSCAFAFNVRAAYDRQGPGTVLAYSPVTRRTYAMTCAGSAPVVCTGGNDASVYLR
jgi:hypothetical protein